MAFISCGWHVAVFATVMFCRFRSRGCLLECEFDYMRRVVLNKMFLMLGLLIAAPLANAQESKSVMPKTMTGGGPAAHAMGAPADTNMVNSGKVLEVLNTDQYSYVKVQTKGGSVWLAGYKGDYTKGATVKYSNGLTMKNFHSKAVDRTFDAIIFVDSMEQVKK